MTFPAPDNEAERLEALKRFEILDTPPEEIFDGITRLLSAQLEVPIALITLVDETRQWFKSRYGLGAESTPREVAFCAHTILGHDIMAVPDAKLDERFKDNPLVTGPPHVRFYGGMPLRTKDGFNLGTLAAVDLKPRQLTDPQRQTLRELARIVVEIIELRRTAQSVVEQERSIARTAEERLTQVQKMEAVGQLTGGLAHDFNNLLAVIMGNAELLERKLGGEDKLVSAIARAAQRGSDLTHRLLAFARQQPLQPRAIDLAALVSGMMELLRRTLGEAIEIESRADPQLWAAAADPVQVENAILNLALNARDAMPEGGKLSIACRNTELSEEEAKEHPEASAGAHVVLEVTDSGSGMTPEVAAHAFEPFFTTKKFGDGSGLGLSMIYGFAKQSGGHVAIESAPGEGTKVRIYLPTTEVAAEHETDGPDSVIWRGRGETVLVVEDDADVRALSAHVLEALNYRVVAVADAVAAGKVLAEDGPIHLLLSDIGLPGGISGPEFAEQARKTQPDLKVIFMSGYPVEAAKLGSFLDKGCVLLNKPFQTQQLSKALRQALE